MYSFFCFVSINLHLIHAFSILHGNFFSQVSQLNVTYNISNCQIVIKKKKNRNKTLNVGYIFLDFQYIRIYI